MPEDNGGDFGVLSNERVIEMPDGSDGAVASTNRARMRFNSARGLWEVSSGGGPLKGAWSQVDGMTLVTGQTVGAQNIVLATIDNEDLPIGQWGWMFVESLVVDRTDASWVYAFYQQWDKDTGGNLTAGAKQAVANNNDIGAGLPTLTWATTGANDYNLKGGGVLGANLDWFVRFAMVLTSFDLG